jgi:hypothetical protein
MSFHVRACLLVATCQWPLTRVRQEEISHTYCSVFMPCRWPLSFTWLCAVQCVIILLTLKIDGRRSCVIFKCNYNNVKKDQQHTCMGASAACTHSHGTSFLHIMKWHDLGSTSTHKWRTWVIKTRLISRVFLLVAKYIMER